MRTWNPGNRAAGTGESVADGDVGEIVVNLARSFTPLESGWRWRPHRRPARHQSPCGRTNMRIKGWMGRADQTTKVQGHVRASRADRGESPGGIPNWDGCGSWSGARARPMR